jgi:pyruvate dehydrogenase E1 component beta subunit
MIAHEATKTGGFGGEVAAVVAEKGFSDLKAPIVRVATKDSPIPQNRGLANAVLLSEDDIVEAAVRLMAGS